MKKAPQKKRHKHHHDWGGKKDDRMRYETGWPMRWDMSGQAYSEGWERIFGKKAEQCAFEHPEANLGRCRKPPHDEGEDHDCPWRAP